MRTSCKYHLLGSSLFLTSFSTASVIPTLLSCARRTSKRVYCKLSACQLYEDVGQHDGPVMLLVDLEEGDQGPAHSEGRAVEGVQKLGPSAFFAVADG